MGGRSVTTFLPIILFSSEGGIPLPGLMSIKFSRVSVEPAEIACLRVTLFLAISLIGSSEGAGIFLSVTKGGFDLPYGSDHLFELDPAQ